MLNNERKFIFAIYNIITCKIIANSGSSMVLQCLISCLKSTSVDIKSTERRKRRVKEIPFQIGALIHRLETIMEETLNDFITIISINFMPSNEIENNKGNISHKKIADKIRHLLKVQN